MLLGSFGVALLVLVAACVPISEPMILGGDHLIWILWLVAPLLATSFLASPSDGSLMKRTPEKNDPKVSQQLHSWYVPVPFFPSFLSYVCVITVIFVFSSYACVLLFRVLSYVCALICVIILRLCYLSYQVRLCSYLTFAFLSCVCVFILNWTARGDDGGRRRKALMSLLFSKCTSQACSTWRMLMYQTSNTIDCSTGGIMITSEGLNVVVVEQAYESSLFHMAIVDASNIKHDRLLACWHHDNNRVRAVLLPTLMAGGPYRCSVGGASPSAHHADGSDLRWTVRCPVRGISHPRPR